jgi:hypothetical protein
MGETTPTDVARAAPLADLCDRDPLDLDADPRLCPPTASPEPCGPLCTPWCLASHPR